MAFKTDRFQGAPSTSSTKFANTEKLFFFYNTKSIVYGKQDRFSQ